MFWLRNKKLIFTSNYALLSRGLVICYAVSTSMCMNEALVKGFVMLAQEKSVVRLTDRLDMTTAVDLDINHKHNNLLEMSTAPLQLG